MGRRTIDEPVRRIIAMLSEAIDDHYDQYEDGINFVLSNLTSNKIITPECADFVLELQCGCEHFHLVRSNQQAVNNRLDGDPILPEEIGTDIAVLVGTALCNDFGAIPIRVARGETVEFLIVVVEYQTFDFNAFMARFDPIATILVGADAQARNASENDVRVCHAWGFWQFFNNVDWP